jgi:cellulose synthase/poly-beta-1,6-N-acetylglucosamine synthase-like glycosyltransferase
MKESVVLSIVVIGRNEGTRLARCFASIEAMRSPGPTELIYVDSGSSDGSSAVAAACGATVIALFSAYPTAAAGRNAGWRIAHAPIVMFLDGDTILHPDFLVDSLNEFARDSRVAVVFGNRREIDPGSSLFNRVLDLDWISPQSHESTHCGGDAMVRKHVLEEVNGFDDSLIAGEEPDMCRRIRGRGYLIVHVNRPMTGHELAINGFRQYWRRAVRSGYAYAEIAHRYRNTPIPFWYKESCRNLLHSGILLAILMAGSALALILRSLMPLGIAVLLMIVLSIRTAFRSRWKSSNPVTLVLYGLHSHLQKIPISVGQVRFWRDRWKGRRPVLIEYNKESLSRKRNSRSRLSSRIWSS